MTASNLALVTDYPGPDVDLESEILEMAGLQVVVVEDATEKELIDLLAHAVAILSCFKPVSARVIDAAPRLRVISRYGIGLDNIDVAHAERSGIKVTRVPGYCVDEVSTHAISMGLSLWRQLPHYRTRIEAGLWGVDRTRKVDRFKGARVAVIGRGEIGSAVALKWRALGATVSDKFEDSALVSLHVPLTPRTTNMVSRQQLSQLAPGAVLVNTSRGGVLDLEACIEAMSTGQLSGLGLDVYPAEPFDVSPLLRFSNIVLSPHVAFYSEASLEELRLRAARNTVRELGMSNLHPAGPL